MEIKINFKDMLFPVALPIHELAHRAFDSCFLALYNIKVTFVENSPVHNKCVEMTVAMVGCRPLA